MSQAVFWKKNKCPLRKVNISGWWVTSFISSFAFQNFLLAASRHFSHWLFPSFSYCTYNGISECHYYWHLGPDNFFVAVAVRCTAGCLAIFLIFTYWTAVAPTSLAPPHDNQKCLQSLLNVPWGTKLLPVENHWLRVTSNSFAWSATPWFLFDVSSSCLSWLSTSLGSLNQAHSLLRGIIQGQQLSLEGALLRSLHGCLASSYPLGLSQRPSQSYHLNHSLSVTSLCLFPSSRLSLLEGSR